MLERKGIGYSVHAPRFGLRLKPSDQQLAGVLLEVRTPIGITQNGQAGHQTPYRLRHDVEVLCRMHRHAGLDPTSDVARPHATAVDHDLRPNVAGLTTYAGNTSRRCVNGRYRAILE